MALICKASELSSTKRLLAIHFYMSMTKAQQFNLSLSLPLVCLYALKLHPLLLCLTNTFFSFAVSNVRMFDVIEEL